MNTPHCQDLLKQDSLEAENNFTAKSPRNSYLNMVGRVWQFVSHLIFNPDEPTVWHKVDRQGRIISWHVYDPSTGHSICFGSEMEVRLWLEHRYYH